LPVGESDKGFGAGKSQTYYTIQTSVAFIDWWHEPVDAETFDHKGILGTYFIRPGFVHGLTNNLNLSFATTIGMRQMVWQRDNLSIHHRDETTISNFTNANGGILGDSNLLLRYLLKNTNSGQGFKLFVGSGITIPSKSVLTSDPFFLQGEKHKDHRHFSLSNGTYNAIIENQIYYRRIRNPVFVGGYIYMERPISENKFGFLPSTVTTLSFSASFMNFDQRMSSIDFGLSTIHTTKSYWNELPSPNSESITIVPSVGYLFNSFLGAVSVNIQKPIILSGAFGGNEGFIDQRSAIWRLSLSLRRIKS
tara:strand:+ start:213 stop:1133 length:921 start_codon:yes stop_codon:yes gene_type:complete